MNMSASEPPESGLDELLRLSAQTNRMEQTVSQTQRTRSDGKEVVRGLKDIKISVALNQLEMLQVPDILTTVRSLTAKASNADLRSLILTIADELDGALGSPGGLPADDDSLHRRIRALPILLELLFALE